ncbi:MAG: polysaccharide biosynthesis protein [Candidatus Puniceispirillaceae bacterium]
MLDRILEYLGQLDRPKKRAIQLLTDTVLIVACFVLAMGLRLDGWHFLTGPRVWDVLFFVIPLTLVVFVRVGLYRAIIRFISSRAIRTIILSTGFSGAVMMVANLALGHLIPRSVPFIYCVLLFCAIAGTRFAVRAAANAIKTKPTERVVIYGAGDAGRLLLNALSNEGEYEVVAFLDDDPNLNGRELDTIVIRSPSELGEIKAQFGVRTVLLAAPSAKIAERRRIISIVEEHALQIRSIPAVGEILSGKAQISDLSEVQVEDLLTREAVLPMEGLASEKVAGKTVMVTGAGGSIGSELCRQIAMLKPDSILLYEMSEFALYKIHDELCEVITKDGLQIEVLPFLGSVQDARRLAHLLSAFEVQTIFHAAAYKHVPLVEQNIIEGIRNNVFGTQAVVTAAIKAGVETLTLVSTDKAVRPTNFMGASKRISELVCQAHAADQTGTCISIVRFGNVLWSSGSVLPRFKEQIRAGGPVTVTHPEVTRYFMTMTEAAQLVMQAGAMAKGGEVFVLDMGEPVKIIDLAKSMIRLHGLIPYVETDKTSSDGDIGISFTGLRPGEKLYEELLVGSGVSGTGHPRIMCADEFRLDMPQVADLLDRLRHACDDLDVDAVNNIIKAAAVEFTASGDVSDLLNRAPAKQALERQGSGKVVNMKRDRKLL